MSYSGKERTQDDSRRDLPLSNLENEFGAGPRASHGTFAEAAAFGEIVFHCALGTAALDVIAAAGAASLAGKVLVDVSNPLDFSQMPPTLFTGPADSLGERIQKAVGKRASSRHSIE